MDILKSKSLDHCLEQVKNMEKSCPNRFNSSVCEKFKNYYRNYCYNTFENKETSSSVNILGGNTLNLINKSPPPSL